MQIPYLPHATAPLSSGHPLALPTTAKPGYQPQRIPSASQAEKGETGSWTGKPPQDQAQQQGAKRNGSDHVAPPSIMQIKISQLLNAQASDIARSDPDAAPKTTKAEAKDPGDKPGHDRTTSAPEAGSEEKPVVRAEAQPAIQPEQEAPPLERPNDEIPSASP